MVYEGSSKVRKDPCHCNGLPFTDYTFNSSNVRKLVGELNFEYHISRTESRGEASRLIAGGPEEDEGGDDSSSSGYGGQEAVE